MPEDLDFIFNINEIQQQINNKTAQLKKEWDELAKELLKQKPLMGQDRAEQNIEQYIARKNEISHIMPFLQKLDTRYETRQELILEFNKFCSSSNLSQEFISGTAESIKDLASSNSNESFVEKSKTLRKELELEYMKTISLIQVIQKENAEYLANLVEDYVCYGKPADGNKYNFPSVKGRTNLMQKQC